MSYRIKKRSRVKRPAKLVGFWRNPSHLIAKSKRPGVAEYVSTYHAIYQLVKGL